MDWYRNFFTPDFTADEESSDGLSDGSLVLPLLSCASPSKIESLPGCTPERSRGTDRQVGGGTLKNVLVIGDSLLRYAGNLCLKNGATLDINPGAKIEHIKQKLLKYVLNQPKIIYIHVGTNNLVDGYNGRPGYNGGWGKRAALHSMADLLSAAKKHFPISDIMLSSVLTRRDIAPLPLFNFNEQLEVMCINFNVTYVDANRLVRGYHLARDGRHLNRAGNLWFGNFIFRCLHERKTFPSGCSPVSAVPGDFRAVPEVSQASVQHKESGNGIKGASCFPE
ncbi:hypothetical protein J6590_077697 [Homalodisca vitripennis]|nr:hypothetical protein J6590_077697 [Homalodisca vitripennis]